MEVHKAKTVFGALSVKTGKILTYTCLKQKGAAAVKLLEKVKNYRQRYWPDASQAILLLWDNGGSHKSADVKQWLVKNPGVIELDNFPPYSPEFNPIEHVWKELKKHINHLRGTATLEEIMLAAKKFLKNKHFHYQLLGLDKHSIFKS